MRKLQSLIMTSIACLAVCESNGQNLSTNSSTAPVADGAAAWKEFQKASTPLSPPGDWQLNRPSQEQIQAFHLQQGAHAAAAADKAKDFYTRFPDNTNAPQAREKEFELMQVAVQLGDTNKSTALQAMEDKRMKDPNLSEEERLKLKIESIQRILMAKMRESGQGAALEEAMEKNGRDLIKEFPKQDAGYQLLLQAAGQMKDPEKGKKLAEEIVAGSAPDEIKTAAKGILRKMEALGKPVNIKFTATDNREVDFDKLKGKVVLLDFWATWCGPCVAEIPEVKETYKKLHPKGFEIVGISLDSDKEKLEQFVAKEEMPWAQYFDGKGWQNKLAQEYGINSIPAMWLVDKKGNLRDMNARGGLAEKVEQMLAE